MRTAIDIPPGYFRRRDGSMAVPVFFGAEGHRLTCPYCKRDVGVLYGYEHDELPDIDMCADCAKEYAGQEVA